jgi:hypothetical protein
MWLLPRHDGPAEMVWWQERAHPHLAMRELQQEGERKSALIRKGIPEFVIQGAFVDIYNAVISGKDAVLG